MSNNIVIDKNHVDYLRHDLATALCRSAEPSLEWNQGLHLAEIVVNVLWDYQPVLNDGETE